VSESHGDAVKRDMTAQNFAQTLKVFSEVHLVTGDGVNRSEMIAVIFK
jgi:hypothetical protein